MLEITDSMFTDKVLNSSEVVMVDFYADWCGPCKLLAPRFEQAEKLLKGKAVVAKCNIDRNPVSAKRCNVKAVPAVLVFKGGKCVAKHAGIADVRALVSLAERAM